MRIRPVRAVSTVTILGTALAATLISAPAQASGANPARPHPNTAGAAARNDVGIMSGVVDGAGGRPLTGACVVATGPGGSVLAMTQTDGRYIFGGLRPGRYTLHYSACAAGGQYVDQWSGGASWPGGAAAVTVTSGQARQLASVTLRTTTAPAAIPRAIVPSLPGATAGALPTGALRSAALAATKSASNAKRGVITGKVTGGGKPLRGICALAYGAGFGQTRTSKTGQYRIAKLPAGRYYVFFSAQYCGKSADDGNWLPQYYKDVNGPAYRHPTRVRVTAGQTTNGIDAALQLGGQISGTVRSQHGKTLSRVCIFAQGKDGRFFVEGNGESGKNGRYDVHSLFPGKYQVAFVPRYCDNTGNYIPQWWHDSATQKHAKTIVIKRGLIVSHVDAALGPGAILSGVVRAGGPHGALLKGICVYVQPTKFQQFSFFAFIRTGKSGSYRLDGLTTGKYRVFFQRGCGNNGNYLNVQRSVSVVAGHTKAGFDAFLPAGAIITGTVTNTHGTPVGGICVSASGPGYGGSTSKADGKYSIIALPSGKYTLDFSGGCGNPGSYAPQYYRGQDNLGSANQVSATAGHTTPGINATMRPGGTITGVVTDASGNRLNRICVLVESPATLQYGFPFNIESTKNGAFTARNLVPGIYAVNFNCFLGANKFPSQWFSGQPGQSTADFVSAPAGAVTSGINAVLQHGGFVTGKVTNSAGKPLSGICVQLAPHGAPIPSLNFFNRVALSFTNSHGVYRIGPVDAAKYDVNFSCAPVRYGNQWYPHTAFRASATPVSVTDDATTTGVNAVLTASGSISGEVTTGASHPQQNVCVNVEDAADNSSGFGFTNRHGRYAVSGLSSGSYQVTFEDCGYGSHHVLLGSVTRSVTVTAPRGVTGLNQKLVPAGAISGIVLGGPDATRQFGVCVVAVPVSKGTSYQYATTGPHGGYDLSGLTPGTYNVYFGDSFCLFSTPGYAPQWYNDRTSQAAATDVTVTAGHDTPRIDATLGAAGAISGAATSHHHTPVAGECVTATPVDPVPDPLFDSVPHSVIGVTAADGTYTLVGLLPGKYTAEFSTGCGDTGFLTQWWHHSSSAAGATVITVSANATVTGIDAALRH
jgi:hypothetical protein